MALLQLPKPLPELHSHALDGFRLTLHLRSVYEELLRLARFRQTDDDLQSIDRNL